MEAPNKLTEPLTPKLAKQAKLNGLPTFVIEAFNECIVRGLDSGKATIRQDEVIRKIIANSNGAYSKQTIFDNKWLDVEDLFRAYGWNVVYDRPGYNETYEPLFIFSEKQTA